MQHPQKQHRLMHSPRKPLIELQPGQVAFRVVCHVSKIGAIIGYSGSVISRIRVETGCLVHCEEAVKGSEHRAILVVGSASPERKIAVGEDETVEVSAAQEAVVRVLERMWEMDAEKDGGDCKGYCGLLANMSQIGAVVGRGGRNIKRMKRASGAHIWILPPPLCASSEDQLIQITGGEKNVQDALFQVTSKLRDNLLPTEMLTRLRAGSPHEGSGEISRLHHSSDESLESNQEASFEKRVDQACNPPSSLLPLPQKLHKGQTTYSTDNGSSSTTSGKVSELERALHFLLPRQVPNRIGGRVMEGD